MTKWHDDKSRALIRLRLSSEYEEMFLKCKRNPYAIQKIWGKIAKEIDLEGQADAVKDKFNDLLKTFRMKKLKANTSGSGAGTWKFYPDFLESNTEGARLLAPNVYDSNVDGGSDEPLSKGELVESYTTQEKEKPKKITTSDLYQQMIESQNIKNELLGEFITVLKGSETQNAEIKEIKHTLSEMFKMIKEDRVKK